MPDEIPLTATQVAQNLAGLARRLEQTVEAIRTADLDATRKRHEATLEFSREFLRAEGPMDARKHKATVTTERQAAEADVADAVVRHLRREIDALKVRIDVGRSYGSAIKAEIALGGAGGGP